MNGIGVVLSGVTQDVTFKIPFEAVVVIDEIEIGLDASTNDRVGKLLCDTLSMDLVGDLFAELGKVALAVGVLDVGEEISTLSHQVVTTPEQITSSTHSSGIDVRLRDHSSTKQSCDFAGVDFIIFDLSAVDGPHVEGVAEDEVDIFFVAEVSDPIPGEHAFDGNDDVFAVWFDSFEEGIGLSVDILVEQDVPVLVEDT